ncbi:aspartic peptidase domain-containing protein [Geranomyces variabilis]|nr:aspartic peptidase domain-containing protein [Geranomyces variabilis]KAJ3140230.1 Vacuolar protease A [Geranomyces variabilis]
MKLVSSVLLVGAGAVAVHACDLSQSGVCHVPLANPKFLEHKVKIQSLISTAPRLSTRKIHSKRQIAIDPLVGTGDTGGTLFAYHGQLAVGSPSQKFNILFDTGSQQLWLQSKGTTGGVNTAGNSFDATKSSTFKNTGVAAEAITYVDGTSVTGTLVQDVVSISNLTIPNLTFELATSITSNSSDMDGIMGMSFSLPATQSTPNEPTFFERLVADNKVTSPVFGYFIDNTNAGGGLTFGGIDQARVNGAFTTLPVAPSGQDANRNDVYLFWQSLLTSISFEGHAGSLSMGDNFAVVFDTGTSLAVLPVRTAATLNSALGMQRASQSEPSADLYVMDCSDGQIPSNLPNIDFTFGSQVISITPQEYIFFQAGSRPGQIACVSGFAGQDITSPSTVGGGQSSALLPSAIFGNVFLRRFYTVFNIKDHTVQLAIANRGANVPTNLVGAVSGKKSAASAIAVSSRLSLAAILVVSTLLVAF